MNKFDFVNNDTIAIAFIGTIGIIGVITKQETIVSAAIGAVGGFMGAKAIETVKTK